MYDVNPLGPMMHLKQLEREALALRATTMRDRSGIRDDAAAWVVRVLKRLSVSLRVASADNSATIGRR